MTNESSTLATMYRQTISLPAPEQTTIRELLRQYTTAVQGEWDSQGSDGACGAARAAITDMDRHYPQLPQTVAALNDDEGLSARIGADHLGHSHVSMTQDRYMSRGRIHTQVADLLDRAVSERDEPRSE